MIIKLVDPIQSAPAIFEIVKTAFTRNFDKCPNHVDEVIDYIKDSDAYIAYENNDPVGYFILKSDPDNIVELKSIAIKETFQGRGLGKQLMQHILEVTKGKKIYLVTHPKNNTGIFMYLKHGFEIVGWSENYLGDGQPRLKLEKQN